jgi:hypothetical protein
LAQVLHYSKSSDEDGQDPKRKPATNSRRHAVTTQIELEVEVLEEMIVPGIMLAD